MELVEQLDQEEIVRTAANKGIKWGFNPPYVPHFGTVHETMINSAKRMNNWWPQLSTFTDGMLTLVNTRPLTHQSANCSVDRDSFLRKGLISAEAHFYAELRLISTEEAHFYCGGSFLRGSIVSTEDTNFLRRSFISTKVLFLRSWLISTAETNFCGGDSFLRGRLISRRDAYF